MPSRPLSGFPYSILCRQSPLQKQNRAAGTSNENTADKDRWAVWEKPPVGIVELALEGRDPGFLKEGRKPLSPSAYVNHRLVIGLGIMIWGCSLLPLPCLCLHPFRELLKTAGRKKVTRKYEDCPSAGLLECRGPAGICYNV